MPKEQQRPGDGTTAQGTGSVLKPGGGWRAGVCESPGQEAAWNPHLCHMPVLIIQVVEEWEQTLVHTHLQGLFPFFL